MGKNDFHNTENWGQVTIVDWEEHGHIGGQDTKVAYKNMFGAPVAYKTFPSLSSGYIYHAVAPVGTASGASVWRVFREDSIGNIMWADGDSNWDNALIDVSSISYL